MKKIKTMFNLYLLAGALTLTSCVGKMEERTGIYSGYKVYSREYVNDDDIKELRVSIHDTIDKAFIVLEWDQIRAYATQNDPIRRYMSYDSLMKVRNYLKQNGTVLEH
jgi:hypothetical protein